jgi:hypothetical protein
MEERTEIVILLEAIREAIKRNPDRTSWQGKIMVNSQEYYWRITRKSLHFLVGEMK